MNEIEPNSLPQASFGEVYGRLKAMASRQLRVGGQSTLNTTELVHEVYLRMEKVEAGDFKHSAQFFAYAARSMRSIIVDLARQRQQIKKGGDQVRLPLTDPAAQSVQVDVSLALALDRALEALEADDPRAAKVVELHFFAGLSLDQVGLLTGVAPRTIDRDWRYARAFLAAHLDQE